MINNNQQQQISPTNLVIFFVMAGALMFAWSFFVLEPQAEQQRAEQAAQAELQQQRAGATTGVDGAPAATSGAVGVGQSGTLATLGGEREAGQAAPRVDIVISDSRARPPRAVDNRDEPNVLTGSINLARGRIDAASLVQYRELVDPDSPVIELLKPADAAFGRFYVDFDWRNITGDTSGGPLYVNDLVEGDWQLAGGEPGVDGEGVTLSRENSVTLVNTIGAARFERRFEIVDNYMLRVTQTVTNGLDDPLLMAPITRITRDGRTERDRTSFTGPVVANDGRFYERNYQRVRDNAEPNGTFESWEGEPGWIGMTDKYWMVAAIPERPQGVRSETSRMRWINGDGFNPRGPDFVVDTRPTQEIRVGSGETVSTSVLVFIGAKEVATLNQYRDEYDIQFFSRGIDFSFLYFITQPFAEFLIWLNSFIGNVGWSIIVMTLIVKAILFYPNDRAYRSMERMKLLQPQVQELNERYADDPQEKSKKMMALYRETGVNPLGGCLPILIQMPVFLALYRVLNVTLETRHAPFILWIEDLSERDPLSILDGFGLIPWWSAPTDGLLTFVSIGPLAILMGLSMVVQQRMSPPPNDPTQRQIFALMPIIFTFVMANFAAGLVIYWTANNVLTIVQQFIIKRSIANDESLKQSTIVNRQKKRFDEQKKRSTK